MTNKELNDVLEKHKKWIEGEEGGERADLRCANLRDAYLADIDLRDADLRYVDLTDADLSEANLRDADLRHADLAGANLRDATLRGANLRDANLREVTLRGANLRHANLAGAHLRDADLRYAELRHTDLSGANLDFSCWPLWCGSIGVKVDKRIVAQLAYHFCGLDCDDPEYQEAREALSGLANQFHRVDECGRIEDHA